MTKVSNFISNARKTHSQRALALGRMAKRIEFMVWRFSMGHIAQGNVGGESTNLSLQYRQSVSIIVLGMAFCIK